MALDKLNSRRTCTEGIFQTLHIEAHFFNTQVWRFFFQKLLEIKVFLIKACVTVFGIIMKMFKTLTSIFEAERFQERRFYLRNDSPDFLSSKCPYLIPSPQGNSNGIYPIISSTHGALEITASAQQLPGGGCVCVYRSPGWRERQHTKYAVTKKVRRWREEVCFPSLVGHSLGSFYGLFKAVVQTKQSFLSFHHDILKDQARGWGRWKRTANSAQKRGCCFTVKALMLTLAAHPQAPS